MILLVAFLYETILRSGLCDIKLYGRPNRSAAGGLRDIIYSVECEFFVAVNVIIIAKTFIDEKLDESDDPGNATFLV